MLNILMCSSKNSVVRHDYKLFNISKIEHIEQNWRVFHSFPKSRISIYFILM